MEKFGYRQAVRSFSRDVWLWFIAWITMGLSYFGIFLVVFNLYLLRLGYGTEFIGLLNGLLTLFFAIFSLPAGMLGGKVGSRRMMIIGLGTTALGLFFLPLADVLVKVQTIRSVWLLLSGTIFSIGVSSYMVNSIPVLAGYTGTKERRYAFSIMAALIPLAGFLGSVLGGFLPGFFARIFALSLDHPGPYRYALFLPALIYFLGMLAILGTAKRRPGEESGLKTPESSLEQKKTPGHHTVTRGRLPVPAVLLLVMACISFCRIAGSWFPRVFFNVYLEKTFEAPPSLIGGTIGLSQLVMVPIALFVPVIAARVGRERSIFGSLAVMGLATLPLALIPNIVAAISGLMVLNMAYALNDPIFAVYHQEIVVPRARAPMNGTVMTAQGIGASIILFGGGYLVPLLGYGAVFLLSGAFSVAGFLLFWLYFRVPRGEFAKA